MKKIFLAIIIITICLSAWPVVAFLPSMLIGGDGNTASLSANPTSIASGSSSTLTWNSTGATSCVGAGFSTGNAKSGSVSTGTLTVTTSYSVQCGAASASATVTVTGGGTIACALGKPYTGTIPAGAAAAGFNTCALNVDMSQPYFQTLSNWLDCSFNGGTAAATPVMWFIGALGVTCNNLSVVSDSGTTALKFTVPAGTANSLHGEAPAFITTNSAANAGQLFPQTMYIAFSARMGTNSNTACNNTYCLTGAFFQYRINPEPGSPYRWTEWDWMEFYPGTNNVGRRPQAASVLQQQASFSGGSNIASYDPLGGDATFPAHGTADNTVKQNFAARVVSDGAGNYSACSYLSGTLTPSCNHGTYANGAGFNDNFNYREQLVVTNQTLPTGNTVQPGDMDFIIFSFTIWECAGWNTGTSVISGRGPLAELGNNCLNTTAAVTGALTGAP